jgi:hypothetical protein
MRIGVAIKIDVSKIDKARLFKGEKGIYLDATAFIDLDQLDQYGNSGMITQDVSKDERAQGVKGNILGNSKVFFKDNEPQASANNGTNQRQQQSYQAQAPADDFGDVPF